MKKHLYYILPIAIVGWYYLVIAFYELTIDFRLWTDDARFLFILIHWAFIVLGIVISFEINREKK